MDLSLHPFDIKEQSIMSNDNSILVKENFDLLRNY